ncbi:hypothetical protein [Allorhodopirellula solitaria]|nr:hypothetical protein [Allorhodopirellula solitaria]
MSETSPSPSENAVAADVSDEDAFDPPRSIAPGPRLSSRGFFIALALVCLIPLTILSTYAVLFGRAIEKELPVSVSIDHRPWQAQQRALQTRDPQQPELEDVIVITNEADFAISKLYADLNGRYFMYVNQPLAAGEKLVLPQADFVNRTGQRWVPGNYTIDEITVMGKLPSGARGVTEFQY